MTENYKVKRYNVDYLGMKESRFGEYVEYADYKDLCMAAKKALDALIHIETCMQGHEVVRQEAIEELKKELNK